MTKIFHVAGPVGFIGLVLMILTGITSIGGIPAREWKRVRLCAWCMRLRFPKKIS